MLTEGAAGLDADAIAERIESSAPSSAPAPNATWPISLRSLTDETLLEPASTP
jgi:hypothetical protein